MNSLIENGKIEEMKYDSNFAFILNDKNSFSGTEYKVLNNQTDDYFIKCMKMTFNGKTQFYYITDKLRTFASILPYIDSDKFMVIMTNLFSAIINVKNNGFLSCQNIDISFEKIYVDVNTLKVKLIYLPSTERFFPEQAIFENELRTSLVKVISSISSISDAKTMQFSVNLSNGMLSLEDLARTIKSGGGFVAANYSPGYMEEKHYEAATEKRMKIVAMNGPVHFSLTVNKDSYLIGKKPTEVDGVIDFNKMISRVHCLVTRSNGEYYIEDRNSANGTYVNNERVYAQRKQLRNGDIIRLANSSFQVVIE